MAGSSQKVLATALPISASALSSTATATTLAPATPPASLRSSTASSTACFISTPNPAEVVVNGPPMPILTSLAPDCAAAGTAKARTGNKTSRGRALRRSVIMVTFKSRFAGRGCHALGYQSIMDRWLQIPGAPAAKTPKIWSGFMARRTGRALAAAPNMQFDGYRCTDERQPPDQGYPSTIARRQSGAGRRGTGVGLHEHVFGSRFSREARAPAGLRHAHAVGRARPHHAALRLRLCACRARRPSAPVATHL